MSKQPKTPQAERDAAAVAVRDNMARLKALRLARDAAAPPPPPKPAKTAKSRSSAKAAKPALGEWLASEQNGGRRT